MKICCTCKTKKENKYFGNNKSNPDNLQKYCKECKKSIAKKWYTGTGRIKHLEGVNRNNARYRNIMREFVWNYLKKHPCNVCGQQDPVLLEFDHVNSKDKENEIATLISTSTNIKVLTEEIEKCQVLCSNCHRRKTSKEFKHWKYIWSLDKNK